MDGFLNILLIVFTLYAVFFGDSPRIEKLLMIITAANVIIAGYAYDIKKILSKEARNDN